MLSLKFDDIPLINEQCLSACRFLLN